MIQNSIYIVVDRKPVKVQSFSTNLQEIGSSISESVTIGKWSLHIYSVENELLDQISDVNYPIEFHHTYMENATFGRVRLSRMVGADELYLDYIMIPTYGTRIDIKSEFSQM